MQPGRSSSWKRWLTPSLADCFFGSLLVWLFASGEGWKSLLADGDTGWHIRTGEHILATGFIPTRDLFSFSRTGEPWFAWEWLSDVILALAHGCWGLSGVVVLAGVLIALTATVVFRHALWRGANALAALAVVLLSAGASSIHYLARPHVFSLFLLAISLWLLDRDRRAPVTAVWLLAPLTVVWVNLHGGFLALLACLGLIAAGCGIEAWLDKAEGPSRWFYLRRYSVLWAVCAAASLANPYGIHLHRHIAGYLRSEWIREAVDEFQSPKFRSENLFQFEILLFAALLLAGSWVARRQVSPALLVLFWAHLSLASVRHVPVFAVVSAPLVAAELSRLWDAWTAAASRKSAAGILNTVGRDLARGFRRTSVWAPALAAAVVLLGPSSKWPGDFSDVKFPVAVVRSHADRLRGARVFTSDQWGDYLIYHGWPRQKVFIDGRSDFYGPALGKEYLQLANGQANWERILNAYDFELALLPPDWPLAALLRRHDGWRLVEESPGAVLFERVSNSPP